MTDRPLTFSSSSSNNNKKVVASNHSTSNRRIYTSIRNKAKATSSRLKAQNGATHRRGLLHFRILKSSVHFQARNSLLINPKERSGIMVLSQSLKKVLEIMIRKSFTKVNNLETHTKTCINFLTDNLYLVLSSNRAQTVARSKRVLAALI